MILLPAIDLLDGRCVRLRQGDFASAHQVAGDPLETALSFEKAGAKWLHMVDLDGARTGEGKNRQIVLEIAKKTGLQVEVGGGIRDMAAIEAYLENGVARVVLGSAAVENPQLVKDAVKRYGEQVAVGIDAKNRKVSGGGWLTDFSVDYLDLAREMEKAGVGWIIFTDIAQDGMLSGPNLSQLAALRKTVNCGLTASGGIRSLEDLKVLDQMGIPAAILGKAVYSGSLDLGEAVVWADGRA